MFMETWVEALPHLVVLVDINTDIFEESVSVLFLWLGVIHTALCPPSPP